MIIQAANEETLRAMEQLEQMAPPPQLRTNLSLIFKPKRQLNPKLDKAEITPMNEVDTEENRLVLKVLSLMLSKR